MREIDPLSTDFSDRCNQLIVIPMTIRPLAFLAVFCSTTLVSGCVETMAYEDNHVLPCDGKSVQMVSQCVGAISALKYSTERYRTIAR